jgi:hypothetical protein
MADINQEVESLLNPPKQSEYPGELEKLGIPSTKEEAKEAQRKANPSTTDTVANFFELLAYREAEEAQESKKLKPEDLRQKYPDLPEALWTREMGSHEARLIADRQYEIRRAQAILASSPDGLYKFGSSMVYHATDPLNVAANLAVGAGVGAIFRGGMLGFQALRGAGLAANVGAVAGRSFAEGLISESLTEAINVGISNEFLDNKTFSDYSNNVFAASVMGVGFDIGGFAVVKGGRAGISKMFSPKYAPEIADSTIAQMAAGKTVETRPIVEELGAKLQQAPLEKEIMLKRTDPGGVGEFEIVGNKYTYEPVTLEQAPNKVYWAANAPDPYLRGEAIGGVRLGNFLYATDNWILANNTAVMSATGAASITKVLPMPNLRLIDFDAPAPKETRAFFAGKIKDSVEGGYKQALDMIKDMPLRDVYSFINKALVDSVDADKRLTEIGKELSKGYKYDGFFMGGEKVIDIDAGSHNSVVLFQHLPNTPLEKRGIRIADFEANPELKNPDNVGKFDIERYSVDESAVGAGRRSNVEDVLLSEQDKSRRIDYDDQAYKSVDEAVNQTIETEVRPETYKKEFDDSVAHAEKLQEMGYFSKQDLEAVKKFSQSEKAETDMLNEATECVRRFGV